MENYPHIKELRKSHNLTQTDIANLLNTAREQYHKYETGKQELPMHHFITLAKYYNVSLDYLAGLIKTPRSLI